MVVATLDVCCITLHVCCRQHGCELSSLDHGLLDMHSTTTTCAAEALL